MMTPRCRPLHQPQEMHLPYGYHGISWVYSFSGGATHGSSKSLNDPIMARTPQHPRGPVLPRIHQPPPMVHQPLCGIPPPPQYPLPEKYPLHFGESESTAFHHLKTAFHLAPVLYHWAPDLPMTVETDASDYAIVGILSITTLDLEICPIAFHFRSLHDTESNYDTHDKELLTVFDCYTTWCHYLEGSGNPIDTVTDHKNLEYFTSTKKLTHQQAHWSEYLSQFNLQICFHPGRLGTKMDALTHHSDVHMRSGPGTYTTTIHTLFTPQQLGTPTSHASKLEYPLEDSQKHWISSKS